MPSRLKRERWLWSNVVVEHERKDIGRMTSKHHGLPHRAKRDQGRHRASRNNKLPFHRAASGFWYPVTMSQELRMRGPLKPSKSSTSTASYSQSVGGKDEIAFVSLDAATKPVKAEKGMVILLSGFYYMYK
jgi:hypothetical protein